MSKIALAGTSEPAILASTGPCDVDEVLIDVETKLQEERKLGRRRKGYRLKMRRPRGKGTEAVWYLAGPGINGWTSTHCTDLKAAKKFAFKEALAIENGRSAHELPRQVALAAILDFGRQVFKPSKDASKGQTKRFSDLEHWIGLFLKFARKARLGDIGRMWCRSYVAWRQHDLAFFEGKPPVPFVDDPVGNSSIHNELVALQKMILAYAQEYQLGWIPILEIPARDKGRVRWLDGSELLRILGAIRGRIWDRSIGDWMREEVVDPVTGETKNVLLLRDEAERRRRREVGYPLFLLGVGTGTRSTAMRRMRWSPSDYNGWIDLEAGELHRAGFASDPQGGKPQTPTALPRLLLNRLKRLRARDAAREIDFVLHRQDGLPYRTAPADVWNAIVADAGLGKDVCIHVMRHTCCTLLIAVGMSVDDAAEYVGMHPATFRRTYKHPTGNGARRVAAFIDARALALVPDRHPGDEGCDEVDPLEARPLRKARAPVRASTRAKIASAMRAVNAARRATLH